MTRSRAATIDVDFDRSIAPKSGVRLAGGYLRLSHEGDLELQRAKVIALAKRHGAVIVEWYEDNDKSASRYAVGVRTEFWRLLDDVRAGRIDMILFYDSDRFLRDPPELEDMIDLCDEMRDLRIEHETGDLNLKTDGGRLIARMLCAKAAGESDATSRREKIRHEQIAKEGRPSGGGMRAFGYDESGMVLREDEAKLIRDAAKRVLAGQSVRSIAREWTEAGVPTATWQPGEPVKPWAMQTVKRILVSARIAGQREHYEHRIVRNRKAGTRKRVREYVGTFPAAWPAIISEEDHARLRSLLGDPGRRTSSPQAFSRRYLLSGLLYCGREGCGQKMGGAQRNGKDGYTCHREGGCHRCGISAAVIDDLVCEAVIARLEATAVKRARKAKAKADAAQGPDPYAEVEAIEARIEMLSDDYHVNGTITAKAYNSSFGKLNALLDDAKARLAAVRPGDALDGAGVNVGTLRAAWPELAVDKRRAIIGTIVERIMLTPGQRGVNVDPMERIDIRWTL